MKYRIIFFISFFLFLITIVKAQDNSRITGIWLGSLNLGSMELRLVLNINDSTGNLVTLLDSPDQGVKGIPTDSSTFSAGKFMVYASALRAKYEGVLQTGDSLLKGTWFQAGQSWDLDLVKRKETFKLNRPQEPKPPFPYLSEEVSFTNDKTGNEFSGTLTIPKGNGPFPAVVLVTGSGPQNRDEELMGHKPFLVIADYLTRNGIVVLRYDDRGVGKSGGKFSSATTLDFADDAEAAFKFLYNRPEADKQKVGIAGHSEGGLIAPIVAARNKAVGFIILLAGPGETGEKIIQDQTELIMQKSGKDKKTIKESLELNKKLFHIVTQEPDSAKALQKMKETVTNEINKSNTIKEDEKAASISKVEAQFPQLLSPWFRTFLVLNPAEYLEKVHCPVLALNGTNDLQVPCKSNLRAISNALKKGGNKNFKTVALEGLNHLFQHSESGLPSEYGKIEETFDPGALSLILSWIKGL